MHLAFSGAPQHDLDAREQLDRLKRLDDIILRAAAQALHLVGDRAERCQKDHRRVAARRADGIQYGKAVESRQHDVEQDEVIRALGNARRSLHAVCALLIGIAADRKRSGKHFRYIFIVFNDQYANHDAVPLRILPQKMLT